MEVGRTFSSRPALLLLLLLPSCFPYMNILKLLDFLYGHPSVKRPSVLTLVLIKRPRLISFLFFGENILKFYFFFLIYTCNRVKKKWRENVFDIKFCHRKFYSKAFLSCESCVERWEVPSRNKIVKQLYSKSFTLNPKWLFLYFFCSLFTKNFLFLI